MIGLNNEPTNFTNQLTRNFSKRSVISNGIDEIWAVDMVDMQKFSESNKGVKYLVMVIDLFSKYG